MRRFWAELVVRDYRVAHRHSHIHRRRRPGRARRGAGQRGSGRPGGRDGGGGNGAVLGARRLLHRVPHRRPLLRADGRHLVDLPYRQRRELLEELGLARPPVVVSPSFLAAEAPAVMRTAEE